MPPPSMVLQLPRLGRVAGVTAAPASKAGPRKLNFHGCRSSRRSSSSSSRSSSWFSSNAENPGPDTRDDNRTSSRRWWSDDQFDVEEEEEEEEFGSEGSFGSAREMFDEPWFTKVFRVYGYVLPVLLASMLVTTGPQAFLMAMAIPLVQSVLSFAISKIASFGRRRRDEEEYDDDGYYYSDYGSGGWEAEEQYSSNSSSTYRGGDSSTGSSRYQQQQQEESADSDPTVESGDINGTTGTAARSESGSTGFGGWDELEEGGDRRSSGRSRARGSPAGTATAGGAVGTSRPPATRRRRSRGAAAARYRQAPLPMRLLIALFPFLGSWFRILL
ncbi:hypothetical protein CFC21_012064 [Triticum aestivum]|nr:uncharacterized protein LOC109763621 [Aegilops tauschii subsp. strangulata]XP_044450105.1 uncharacterized protein LOC123181800 [Triticum aestivum]KAF6995589.1 hypothetical protein CFC21_012064 [Triticum aestivum]